jgi:uncharacterized protein (TIGR03437 family)
MKANLRQTKLTLLLGLLALSGFSIYAYRASERWRSHSAAPAEQPTAILSRPRGRHAGAPAVTLTGAAAGVHSEAPPKDEEAEHVAALAPAQSGGSYNITQSVISGGGGESSNGNTNVTGALGQSIAATSSGGQYAVSGGFLSGAGADANCAALTINPAALPAGSAGASYNQSLTATGNTGAVSFTVSAGALPNGLQLSTGGLLSGAPTAFGAFNFSVRATDANGCESMRAYRLVICGPLALSPSSLPGGVTGVAYSQTITAVSGVAPYSYSLSAGSLPGGLTLSAAGTLAGAPVSAGIFNFTVTVTDSLNCQGARGYTLTINSGAVAALTTLSPGFAITGGGGVTLTVIGVNFTSGMIVRWNGADRVTSFISSVELRAAIPAGDLTGNGRAGVTVFNPSTAATTAALSFLVVNQMANVSAASYDGATLAQEAILAAFGERLATTTQSAISVPLPTSLGGTIITVRDSLGEERQSPLFFVSPGQVNFQLPPGTALGQALIYLSNSDGLLAAQTAQIAGVAPGLFTANSSGQGLPAALVYRLKADNTLTVEALASFDAAQNRFIAVPIDLGPAGDQVFLVLYGAGIRFRSALSAVSCAIGGVSASVEFAGKTEEFIGLDQINVRLPRSLAGRGEVDVVLTVDGKTANTVRVAFK